MKYLGFPANKIKAMMGRYFSKAHFPEIAINREKACQGY